MMSLPAMNLQVISHLLATFNCKRLKIKFGESARESIWRKKVRQIHPEI